MKYFFRSRIPEAADVLMMESGSPEVARRALEGIRGIFPKARFHLCTCQPDPAQSAFTSVFNVTEYSNGWQKLRLLGTFWSKGWNVLVILCTGEPILWRYKVLAVLMLPAKVLIVNENGDYFWLDWENRRTLRRLVGNRWGVNRQGLIRTLLRALVFPLTFLLLLATAAFYGLRRAFRLMIWKFERPGGAGVAGRSASR